MSTRTPTLEAELVTIPGYAGGATVVAIPPSDASPAAFMMLIYIDGQVIGRTFDPALVQP